MMLISVLSLCFAVSSAGQIFVSTTGNDITGTGSIDLPFRTIPRAISVFSSGDTIYVRGGVYVITAQVTLSSSGVDSLHRSCLMAYPGERPLLDFDSIGTRGVSGSADGIRITGRYWYVEGLDIKGAPHNGIALNGGSYNIVEYCAMYENRNTGLQIGNGGSYNRIINCDSYFNRDSTNSSSYDGNADGFSPKLDVGTGNYFYGCRSWQNSDDGWDGYMRPSDNVFTTLENCWCFSNGYRKNGLAGTGNGNGFKMGGGDKVGGASNGDSLRHNMTLINCLSFNNLVKGFDQNNNRGTMTLLNCTGYANGTYNFSVPGFIRVGQTLTVKNCISLGSSGVNLAGVPNPILATNSWPDASTYPTAITAATIADFISVDTSGVRGPRKPDGSLPDITFMHLAPGSQFIDAGTNVGLTFNGSAPDLGCFETSGTSGIVEGNKGTKITGFQLSQNYPNPFNPSTKIAYQIAKSGIVTLKVYDLLGREVVTLVNEIKPAGSYTAVWNAASMPSGMYFSRLESNGEQQIIKMVLLK